MDKTSGERHYLDRFKNRTKGNASRSQHYKHDKERTLYKADRVGHHRRRTHTRTVLSHGTLRGLESLHGPSTGLRRRGGRNGFGAPSDIGGRQTVRAIGHTRHRFMYAYYNREDGYASSYGTPRIGLRHNRARPSRRYPHPGDVPVWMRSEDDINDPEVELEALNQP
jgi:hypothetical protein